MRGSQPYTSFYFSTVVEDIMERNLDVVSGFAESRFIFSSLFNNSSKTESSSPEDVRSLYDWKDKTILIAEDEETNFMYLKAALSRTSVNIIRARNGIEAVDAVKSDQNIDLVLMDVKMPEMDGVEATKIIKSFNKDMVVIAQTAYAMEEDQYVYMNAGCNDYLAKPITLDRLLQCVSKYLK
jgi:CheY-like chemotaxis protein